MTYQFPKARLLPSCFRLYWWGHKNHLGRAFCYVTPGGKRVLFKDSERYKDA